MPIEHEEPLVATLFSYMERTDCNNLRIRWKMKTRSSWRRQDIAATLADYHRSSHPEPRTAISLPD